MILKKLCKYGFSNYGKKVAPFLLYRMLLQDIPRVAAQISFARSDKIKMFPSLIIPHDGNRGNWKNLRSFAGFQFFKDDTDYNDKLADILERFSHMQLISVANLLHLIFSTESTENRIFTFLKR